MADEQAASTIAAFLDDHSRPRQATIASIARGTGLDEGVVHRVLDEHLRDGDTIEHVGPGKGGGWIPAPSE